MYTIFYNEIPIFLTDNDKKLSQDYFFNKDDITIENLLMRIGQNEFEQVVLYHYDLKKLWKEFKWYFKIEKAAGGLVRNFKNETLFIYRLGKWDLPKGKIENGEKKREAAVREVIEECGVQDLKIESKLERTYHIFQRQGVETLKITFWYLMKTNYKGELIPQTEEDITDVVFKSEKLVKDALNNTYKNIELLFRNIEV